MCEKQLIFTGFLIRYIRVIEYSWILENMRRLYGGNAKKGDFLRLLSGKGGENSKNGCFLSFVIFWGGEPFWLF